MTAVANVTYYAPDNSTCGLPREDAWQVLRQVLIVRIRNVFMFSGTYVFADHVLMYSCVHVQVQLTGVSLGGVTL